VKAEAQDRDSRGQGHGPHYHYGRYPQSGPAPVGGGGAHPVMPGAYRGPGAQEELAPGGWTGGRAAGGPLGRGSDGVNSPGERASHAYPAYGRGGYANFLTQTGYSSQQIPGTGMAMVHPFPQHCQPPRPPVMWLQEQAVAAGGHYRWHPRERNLESSMGHPGHQATGGSWDGWTPVAPGKVMQRVEQEVVSGGSSGPAAPWRIAPTPGAGTQAAGRFSRLPSLSSMREGALASTKGKFAVCNRLSAILASHESDGGVHAATSPSPNQNPAPPAPPAAPYQVPSPKSHSSASPSAESLSSTVRSTVSSGRLTQFGPCRVAGCQRSVRFVSWGVQGAERPVSCSAHRMLGQLDIKRPKCRIEGCSRQPSFGFLQHRPRFCGKHRQEGMVDVKNPRCQQANCTKRPRYGFDKERPKFCATHRHPGMEDLVKAKKVASGQLAQRIVALNALNALGASGNLSSINGHTASPNAPGEEKANDQSIST
jgi:hypothetical protein